MESYTNHNLVNKNNDLIYQLDYLLENVSYNDFPILKSIYIFIKSYSSLIILNLKK